MEEVLSIKETWQLWTHSLVWTLIGIAFIKAYIFPYRTEKFSWKYWIKNNTKDVIIGILATLILMKLGDVALAIAAAVGLDTAGLASTLQTVNLDPTQLALIVSMFVQWHLHKRKDKLKLNEPK